MNIFGGKEDQEVKLESSTYGTEYFCLMDLDELEEDERGKTKFIRNVEKYIRSSNEYKRWLTFVKGTLGSDLMCYHTGNLPTMCSLEIHHHPYTLYSLVEIAMFNMQGEVYTVFDLAKNVMKLHFMNLVGFVPLCISSHENYHNQILDIPIEVCEGNWKELDHYFNIPDHIVDDIKAKSAITFNNARSSNEWKVRGNLYILDKDDSNTIKKVDTSEWS